MAKSSNDVDFIQALRASRGGAGSPPSGAGMVLHTPPSGPKKSLDELLDGAPSGALDLAKEAATGSIAQLDQQRAHSDDSLGRIISIEALDTHPWNARVHRSADRIREIASSIAASRQMNPITITPNPDKPGRFYVVDGETRFRGLKLLNRKDAWVLEIDVDPHNAAAFYVASFKQTDATEKISPIDQGIRWGELIEKGYTTATAIAEMLEVSVSTVSRMQAYRKFPSLVLDFMHANADKFPYSIVAIMTPLIEERGLSEEELLAKCQEIVEEQHSRRAIEAMIKERSGGAEKRPRKTALVAIPIKAGKTQIGSFRTYESGAIEFKLEEPKALREETLKTLSNVFELVSGVITEGHDDVLSELVARLQNLRPDGP